MVNLITTLMKLLIISKVNLVHSQKIYNDNSSMESQYSEIIDKIIENTSNNCSLIFSEFNSFENLNFLDLVTKIQENNKMTLITTSLSHWRSSTKSLQMNRCLIQVVVGAANNLIPYIDDIWDKEWCNRGHKYIVITDRESIKEVGQASKINDVMDLIIILLDEINSSVINIHQIEPYGGQNNNPILKSKFSWIKRLKNFYPSVNPFPNKFKNLNGKVLKSAFLETFPYIFRTTDSVTNEQKYDGIDHKIISAIGELLNYTITYRDSVDGKYGSRNATSNAFNGMIGMTQRQEVDFTVGSITQTPMREEVIDFSFTTFHTHSTFITRKPAPVPKWKSMFEPFQIELWISLIIAVFGFLFSYFLFLKVSNFEESLSFSLSSLNILGSFINQGIKHPRESSSRILIGSWFLFSICIAATYGGSLISYLTLPRRQAPIDTLKQLDKSDLNVVILNGTLFENEFRDSKYPIYQSLWKKFVQTGPDCDTLFNCFEFTRDIPGWSYIMDYDLLESLKITSSFDENEGDNLHLASEEFIPSQYAIVLRKNSPYLSEFDSSLIKLRQAGLINLWRNDILIKRRFENKQKLKKNNKKKVDKSSSIEQPITLDHLQGAFIVYLIGIGSGIMIFSYEKIVLC
ncbi:ionotropic receptor 21a-like [Lepeophtheirus salmonis]|uniref:ionotropic receptor 21a-like n=1 Tax=Lepeophtheirus salmonis TaxID=72036 RepID=UPI003AF37DAA